MIENSYPLNNGVRETANITDENGNLVDPDTFVWKVESPAGAVSTYTYGTDAEAVRSGVGAYYIDILGDEVGVWYWRWETTNPWLADESAFIILPSEFD